jgi:hypothetical protein
VQVTHLHHAQGIAAGIGQLTATAMGQGALGSVGAQIIGSSSIGGGSVIIGSQPSAQTYNALVSQIGGLSGLTYQAAQAQAQAQAQAIVNARLE